MSKLIDLELEYINRTSWLVRENANVNESAITLFWYVAKQSILDDVLKFIPPRAVKAHREGWIHINKLFDGGWYLPYCCGVDTARILQKGLITPNISSKPPKHLDSAVDQLANFIMMMAQERSVTGDTPVLVKVGNVWKIFTIEELYRDYGSDKIIHVLAFTPEGKIVEAPARIVYHGKHRVIRITLEDGSWIDVTPDHSVFKYENGKIVLVKAGDLKVGDSLVIPHRLNIPTRRLEIESFAICDGGEIPVEMFEIDEDHVKKFLKKVFHKFGRVIENANGISLEFSICSWRFAVGLVYLLARFGIRSRVVSSDDGSFKVIIDIPESVEKFVRFIDLEESMYKFETYRKSVIVPIPGTDLAYVKIVKIEDVGERDVYDFEVPPLENFIAGWSPICLHNTGAIGLNAIDLYLAPYIAHDKLDYEQVKQCIQRFIYNLNYTTRVGYQTPFSNVTFGLGVKEYYSAPAYVGGRIVGKLGDYVEEAKLVLKAFCEILLEGDAYGRPFSVAGDEITIARLDGRLVIDEIGKIIDKLFEKYGDYVLKFGKYEILPLAGLDVNLEVLGISNAVPTFQKVLYLARHREDSVIEIKTDRGFTIKVTDSHSVLVWEGGKIVVKEAKDLKIGDELVALISLPEFGRVDRYEYVNIAKLLREHVQNVEDVYVKSRSGEVLPLSEVDVSVLTDEDEIFTTSDRVVVPAVIKLDEEFSYLLGIFTMRGILENCKVVFRFNIDEFDIAKRVVSIFENVFGIKPILRFYGDSILVEVDSRIVSELFKIFNVDHILESSPIVKISFISGIVDSIQDLELDNDEVVLKFSNKKLMYLITYLLLSLGIEVYAGDSGLVLRYSPLYREFSRFSIKLSKTCTGKSVSCVVADGCGFVGRLKVVDIRRVEYSGYVYDFTTSSENFLAGVVVVHNTFPIPTIILTNDWIKIVESDAELSDLFWRCVAERGSFYFLNSLTSDRTGIFSFCCRLTVDVRKVVEYLHMSRGVWALPPSTGSIGYITINLPRIAIEASMRGDAEKYVDELLYEYMNIGREVLNILRARYTKLHKLGYYPLTRLYIDEHDPFKYYYNTIAVTGMAEYVSIILNEPKLWFREISFDGREYVKDVIRVYKRTFEYMGKILEEFEEEDRVLYNLEQAPAESSSYKFARLDWERYPKFREFIPHGVDPFTGREEPYYTSQNTPPYTSWRIQTQIAVESEIQKLFTGGVMKHIFVHRPVKSEKVRELVLSICEKTDIVYLSYAPTQSICLDCGYRTTEVIWECPKCGSKNVEQWTRIVGYYRPVRSWNPGRRTEFAMRRDFAQDFA